MEKLDDLKITLTNFPDRTSLHDCMYEVQDLGELSVSISIEFFFEGLRIILRNQVRITVAKCLGNIIFQSFLKYETAKKQPIAEKYCAFTVARQSPRVLPHSCRNSKLSKIDMHMFFPLAF